MPEDPDIADARRAIELGRKIRAERAALRDQKWREKFLKALATMPPTEKPSKESA